MNPRNEMVISGCKPCRRSMPGAWGVLGLGLLAGCSSSSSSTNPDSGSPDGGATGFQPSNVSLAGMDVSGVQDEDISKECVITTDATAPGGDCFSDNAVATVAKQPDGSAVTLIVVKSMTLEAAASIRVTGGVPLVIVALGDMTLFGNIDGHSADLNQGPGGFLGATNSASSGEGPGGGPGGSGTAHTPGNAAGGASYCGVGGKGSAEQQGPAPGAPAAAYGNTDLRPLAGGSSGGAGVTSGYGIGGGAIQLVALGTFTMKAGSYITVGGQGGGSGGTTGQGAGGGGSGGSILVEATSATVAGILAANGGGGGSGGGGADGQDATPNATAAPGGGGAVSPGGSGSGGIVIAGSSGQDTATNSAGAGGGGAGRIRINTSSGTATLAGATLSPDVSTSCVSQGQVRASTAGP